MNKKFRNSKPGINEQKILRLLDANFNRAKEGFRVCEDICRFILNDAQKTAAFKTLRHRLTKIVEGLPFEALIKSRDVEGDIGKKSLKTELQRKDVADIFYANSQRIKESLRVLEEFVKLSDKNFSSDIKEIRYKIYELEKNSFS